MSKLLREKQFSVSSGALVTSSILAIEAKVYPSMWFSQMSDNMSQDQQISPIPIPTACEDE